MTQLTKEEIGQKLKELDDKISPEEKLKFMKEMNGTLDEMNDAMEEFIEETK